MTITWVGIGALKDSAGWFQNIAVPAGVQTDDLLVYQFGQKGGTTVVLTLPSGWVRLSTYVARSSILETWVKRCDGTEGATVQVSGTNSGPAGQWIYALRGVDVSDIANLSCSDATPVTSDSAASATFTPTGITTATAGAWVASHVYSNDDNASTVTAAQGFTARREGTAGDSLSGQDCWNGLATKEQTTAGAVTCPTWTQQANGTDTWVAVTHAFKPSIVNATASPAAAAMTLAAPAVTADGGTPTCSEAVATVWASSTTTHNVGLPAVTSGDVALIAICFRDITTVTTPTGWTLVGSQSSGGVGDLRIYSRVCDGSEGSTVNVATSVTTTGAAHARVVRGATGDVEVGFFNSGGVPGGDPDPPSLSPTWGAEDTLWLAVMGDAASAITVSGYPSGYSDGRYDAASAGGASAGVGTAYKMANTATEDPGVFSTGGDRWCMAATVALRPEGGSVSANATPAAAVLALAAPAATVAYSGAAAPATAALAVAIAAVDLGQLGGSLPTVHTPNVGLTFYIDAVNGSDSTGDGSIGAPWQTMAKAFDYLRFTATWPSGQDIRIYMRAGTYQGASTAEFTVEIAFDQSGRKPTSTQWVIWEAYAGEAVVVMPPDGTNDHKYGVKHYSDASTYVGGYQQYRGIHFSGGGTRRGGGTSSNDQDVAGIYVSYAGATVAAGPVEVIGCTFEGFQANGNGAGGKGTFGKAQGIYIDPNTAGVEHKITDSVFYDIGTTTDTIDGQEHAIYTGTSGTKIWNVAAWNLVNGFGIQVYRGGGAINDILIANVTVVDVYKSPIVVPGHGSNITIRNAVLAGGNNWGIEYVPNTATGTGNTVDYVTYYDNTGGNREASLAGWTYTNEQTADPLFVDAGTRDYRLSSGSPAIGYADPAYAAATDLDGNARDSAPDGGAYEFASADATATPAAAALAVTAPAATPAAGSMVAPAAAALAIAAPAAAPTAGSTAAVAAAVAALAAPAAAPTAGSAVTAAAAALSLTAPVPAVTGGSAAAVEPAALALDAAATPAASAAVNPGPVAVAVAIPAPSPVAGAASAPAAAALALAVPAAAVTVTAARTPEAAALTVVAAAATPSAGATAAPDPAALDLDAPAATATGGSADTANPATAALAIDAPAATATAGSTAAPDAAALDLDAPAVTAVGGSSAAAAPDPAVLALNTPAPTITATGSSSPAAVAVTLGAPPATPTAGSAASPAVAALGLVVAAVTAGGSTIAPVGPVALLAAYGATTTVYGASAHPAVAALVLTPTSTVATGASLTLGTGRQYEPPAGAGRAAADLAGTTRQYDPAGGTGRSIT